MTDAREPSLDTDILSYYTTRREESRLDRGLSQLERIRTQELIARHAPAAPATFLDVGGAAGAYAFWLADAGYNVHLVDPVPRLIDEAKVRNARAHRPLHSITVADARALTQATGTADSVLLLGPLYHLTTAVDRSRALAEARRVLRPGGILFAAAISRWASLLDGLVHHTLAEPDFAAAADRAVHDGQHRNPTARDGMFTTAYFHRPDELRDEIVAAGFDIIALYGVEGPARMVADCEARWANERQRAEMLRIASLVETEPALLGLSGHLLLVARQPT